MNTDTAEPAKSLGMQFRDLLLKASLGHPYFKPAHYEKAAPEFANAVIQQFLSVGPVSAEDFKKALDVTHLITKDWDALERLNQTLRARHANPVQAEGGEWKVFEIGKTIIEKGDEYEHPAGIWDACPNFDFGRFNSGARVRRRIPTVQPGVAPGSPEAVLVPQEPKQAVVADVIRPSVIYREGRPSAEDYTDAIDMLIGARQQLAPDGENCACCGDSGHQAWECHHNPLVMARKAAKQEFEYRCWHCGYVARSQEQGDGHFGKNEEGCPACKRPTSAPESASATVAQEGPSGNPPTAAQEQGGTQKERVAVEVAAYRREVEKWKANYVEVHDQLTASQARVATLTTERNRLDLEWHKTQSELLAAQERVAEQSQTIATMRNAGFEEGQTVDSLRADLEAMEWRLASLQKSYDGAQDEANEINANLIAAGKDMEAMKARAEKEHSEQLHLISLREKQLMETSESVDEFQKENAALSAQSAEHVRQITMDAGTIKRLQDVGFESDLKVQELEKEITALRQERDRSDQDWANAKKECESLRFRLTESNRVLAHTELSQVTEQRDKALAELGEERAWTGKQKAELQEANGIIAQLRSRSGVLSSQQVKTAITIVAGNLTNRRNGIMEHGYGMIAEKLNASLQPPWRTIIAGDPASPNDYVLFGGGGMDFVAGQFRDRHEARTHYMPIPPLPTPKVSEGDEPTFLEWWQHVWNTPDYQKLSSSAAEKIWQAARTSQAVEEKAL